MMDYKEMAEIVTKEVDAILERKKIRAMRIKKVSLAVSGLCAAVLVCFGVWKLRPSLNDPFEGLNGTDIVTTTEVATESIVTGDVNDIYVTSTAEKNAAAVKTTETESIVTTAVNNASAVKTTATAAGTAVNRTTSGVAAANNIKTTSVHRTAVSTQIMTTTKADTKTTVVTAPSTTKTEPLTTSKEKHTTAPLTTTSAKVQTENPQTGVVIDTTSTVTTEIKHQGGVATSDDTNFRMFHESTATVAIDKNDTSVNYEKQNILIETERIGDFIAVKTINALLPDGTKWILHFGVYKISDIDMEEAVAVRFVNPFGFTQGYFMFTDPNYNKAGDTLIDDS